jgi:hypothetical protein
VHLSERQATNSTADGAVGTAGQTPAPLRRRSQPGALHLGGLLERRLLLRQSRFISDFIISAARHPWDTTLTDAQLSKNNLLSASSSGPGSGCSDVDTSSCAHVALACNSNRDDQSARALLDHLRQFREASRGRPLGCAASHACSLQRLQFLLKTGRRPARPARSNTPPLTSSDIGGSIARCRRAERPLNWQSQPRSR